MFGKSPAPSRRDVLAASAAVGAASLFLIRSAIAADETNERSVLRPFSVRIPEETVLDLRRRIAATRWPDQETVNDRSQGVQLAKIAGAGPLLGH